MTQAASAQPYTIDTVQYKKTIAQPYASAHPSAEALPSSTRSCTSIGT